ncbi:MAG: hypothetical protein KAS96_02655 [Planctomycetes bacterium]|nr:hypothetical protein [Planctomycetota bacterium]
MDNVNKNRGLDKLALLSILVISIAIAALIVMLKTRTSLTSPITLKHINLSASVPTNNGWQSKKQWVFIDDGFTLRSIYRMTSQKTSALAQCRYRMPKIQKPVELQMKQKAFSLKDKITQQGQIVSNSLNFDWTMIGNHTFYAVSNLPNNRLIEVEVQQIANETEWARNIFFDIIDSVKYDNTSIEAANQLVSDLKKIGPAKLIKEKKQKNFFLINNQKKKPIGFTMETYLKSDQVTPLDLRAATFFYIRSNNLSNEQVTFFQGNDTIDRFYWKSETNSIRGKKSIEIVVNEPSSMTVTKFSHEAATENFHLSPAAMPDIFMNQLLELFIASKYNEVTVDIIEAEGVITPALLTKLKPASSDTDFLVKIIFLDGSEFFEDVYFNQQKQVTKRLIHQNSIFVIERTTEQKIAELFPERVEYFNEGQILEENKI